MACSENRDLLRAVSDHPSLNNVVVEVIEVLSVLLRAVDQRLSLQFILQADHFGLHVLRPEEGHREVLTQQVRQESRSGRS